MPRDHTAQIVLVTEKKPTRSAEACLIARSPAWLVLFVPLSVPAFRRSGTMRPEHRTRRALRLVAGDQTVFITPGTFAGKGSTLLWSSGDAPLGRGMVAKMRVPELSDSIFMVPSN
jgi:hypothetical protein